MGVAMERFGGQRENPKGKHLLNTQPPLFSTPKPFHSLPPHPEFSLNLHFG